MFNSPNKSVGVINGVPDFPADGNDYVFQGDNTWKVLPPLDSSGKNLIINGAMSVAQRGTSVSAITGNGYYTIDRMRLSSGTAGTYNSSQEELPFDGTHDVIPSGILHYLKYESITSNKFAGIQNRIEDVRILASQTVTVSFYAKGVNPNGGTLAVRLTQNFGSGGSSNVGLTDTITLTSSWQRFEVTFNVGSLEGKTIGAGSYNIVALEQSSENPSTDAWNMDLTGLQIEFGDKATDFEYEDYAATLRKCQRYYLKYTFTESGGQTNKYGGASGLGMQNGVVSFPTEMFSTPTFKLLEAPLTHNCTFDESSPGYLSPKTYEVKVNSTSLNHYRCYSGKYELDAEL